MPECKLTIKNFFFSNYNQYRSLSTSNPLDEYELRLWIKLYNEISFISKVCIGIEENIELLNLSSTNQ